MLYKKIYVSVRPFVTSIAVIVIIGLLVFAIYFTELGMQWILFLSGILLALIFGIASRASRAEWIIVRRTAQLAAKKINSNLKLNFGKKPPQAINNPSLYYSRQSRLLTV